VVFQLLGLAGRQLRCLGLQRLVGSQRPIPRQSSTDSLGGISIFQVLAIIMIVVFFVGMLVGYEVNRCQQARKRRLLTNRRETEQPRGAPTERTEVAQNTPAPAVHRPPQIPPDLPHHAFNPRDAAHFPRSDDSDEGGDPASSDSRGRRLPYTPRLTEIPQDWICFSSGKKGFCYHKSVFCDGLRSTRVHGVKLKYLRKCKVCGGQ